MFPFVTQFRDRTQAWQLLADKLAEYANLTDVLVLGLPRGGVPVAFEVAKALNAPLDIIVVRKLGVPGHEELAMGAIAPGGLRFLDAGVVEPAWRESKKHHCDRPKSIRDRSEQADI